MELEQLIDVDKNRLLRDNQVTGIDIDVQQEIHQLHHLVADDDLAGGDIDSLFLQVLTDLLPERLQTLGAAVVIESGPFFVDERTDSPVEQLHRTQLRRRHGPYKVVAAGHLPLDYRPAPQAVVKFQAVVVLDIGQGRAESDPVRADVNIQRRL